MDYCYFYTHLIKDKVYYKGNDGNCIIARIPFCQAIFSLNNKAGNTHEYGTDVS